MSILVLITSIIKTPQTPLSYGTRSIYTTQERFEHTKKTIQTVKEKIPNCKIFVVECSDLDTDQYNYFIQNTDYLLNLYNDQTIRNNIYSTSKSLCEGTMTYHALKFINDIPYDTLFKISGRYWLSEKFNHDNFIGNDIVVKYINGDKNNVLTALYKLSKEVSIEFKNFLSIHFDKMHNFIGYEILFGEFLNSYTNVKNINPIGLAGYVSVSGDYYDG